VDLTRWEEWRAEIIPEISAAVVRRTFASAIPSSFSMQALFVPSPQIDPSSPNIGTFSPRPAEPSRMLSLAEALGDPFHPPEKVLEDLRASPSRPSVDRIPWAALEQEGLSRDVLLSLDARLIARSLCLFHRSILELTPENLTADLVIGTGRNAPTDDGHEHTTSSFKALFGSEEHPHWLTKLLLIQILSADTSASHVPNTPTFDERSVQTSRTRSRSEVISVWTKISELCRLAGDECSWRAIEAALCSGPVARLEKAWRRADGQALAVVESWVNSGSDGERASVSEPRVTPWGGDVISRIEAEMARTSAGDGEDGWNASSFQKIRRLFNDLRTAFSLCPRRTVAADDEVGDDLQRMILFWHKIFTGEGGGAIASKFLR
jgi:GTPase-activating protein BEM2